MTSTERAKSAPPNKISLFSTPNTEEEDQKLRDESSERQHTKSKSDKYNDTTSSNQSSLKTMSARSFGFIPPSQKLLQREQNKKIRRHKSFFGDDGLLGKKNTTIKRAESFHCNTFETPATKGDIDLFMRTKSVECLDQDILNPGGVKPQKRSKSMEFIKSKILRRPSKLLKNGSKEKVPKVVRNTEHLQINNEMRESPSSYYPYELSKKSQDHSVVSNEYSNFEKQKKTDDYDWRQDTPFWKNKNGRGRKETKSTISVNDDQPPSWSPPPPPNSHQKSTPIPSYIPMMGSPYPGLPLTQAVNTMYLPINSQFQSPPYPGILNSSYQEESLLEIKELGDHLGSYLLFKNFYKESK